MYTVAPGHFGVNLYLEEYAAYKSLPRFMLIKWSLEGNVPLQGTANLRLIESQYFRSKAFCSGCSSITLGGHRRLASSTLRDFTALRLIVPNLGQVRPGE